MSSELLAVAIVLVLAPIVLVVVAVMEAITLCKRVRARITTGQPVSAHMTVRGQDPDCAARRLARRFYFAPWGATLLWSPDRSALVRSRAESASRICSAEGDDHPQLEITGRWTARLRWADGSTLDFPAYPLNQDPRQRFTEVMSASGEPAGS